MKIKIATLAVVSLLLAACSSKPPKVGADVIREYSIKLNEKSSDALTDVAALGAVGVRDLTAKEFGSVRGDTERFGAISSARKGIGAGYHAATGAMAFVGGMSLGDVLGIGLASALFTDSRPDNYDFAKDFSSSSRVFANGGVDRAILINAQKASIEAMTPEILKSLSIKSDYKVEYFNNEDSGLEGYRAKVGNLIVAYFFELH